MRLFGCHDRFVVPPPLSAKECCILLPAFLTEKTVPRLGHVSKTLTYIKVYCHIPRYITCICTYTCKLTFCQAEFTYDLIVFVHFLCLLIYNVLSRPFARWCHFTNTTRILNVFPFIFKFGYPSKD